MMMLSAKLTTGTSSTCQRSESDRPSFCRDLNSEHRWNNGLAGGCDYAHELPVVNDVPMIIDRIQEYVYVYHVIALFGKERQDPSRPGLRI